MKTRYGVSYWLDRFPKSRQPVYPRHRGELSTQVAILGGRLTGCAIAYVFAAAGAPRPSNSSMQSTRGGIVMQLLRCWRGVTTRAADRAFRANLAPNG